MEQLPHIAQWKEFGRSLGIDEEQLNVIEVDTVHTHGHLSKVIEHWLKRNHNEEECGPPTWGNLVKAFKPINKALAVNIEAKHGIHRGKKHNTPNMVLHDRSYSTLYVCVHLRRFITCKLNIICI